MSGLSFIGTPQKQFSVVISSTPAIPNPLTFTVNLLGCAPGKIIEPVSLASVGEGDRAVPIAAGRNYRGGDSNEVVEIANDGNDNSSSDSLFQCIQCKSGTYSLLANLSSDGDTSESGMCLNCPLGADCRYGANQVYTRHGFWRDTDVFHEAQSHKCSSDSSCCPDDYCEQHEQCPENHEGVLCSSCSEGYSFWNNMCMKCTETGYFSLAMIALALIIMALLLVVMPFGIFATFDVLVFFYQLVPMLVPSMMRGIFDIMNVEVGDTVIVFTKSCLFPVTASGRIVARYIGPFSLWFLILHDSPHLFQTCKLVKLTLYHPIIYTAYVISSISSSTL